MTEDEKDAVAYQEGWADGRREGYDEGHADGHREGYDKGHAAGKADGSADGAVAAYRTGFDDGFAAGRLIHAPPPKTAFWSAQALARLPDGSLGVFTGVMDVHPVLWAADHGRHLVSYHEIPEDVFEALRAHKNAVEAEP